MRRASRVVITLPWGWTCLSGTMLHCGGCATSWALHIYVRCRPWSLSLLLRVLLYVSRLVLCAGCLSPSPLDVASRAACFLFDVRLLPAYQPLCPCFPDDRRPCNVDGCMKSPVLAYCRNQTAKRFASFFIFSVRRL